MEFALFQTPFIAPERTPRQVFDWAVDQIVVAEQVGMTECWVGEHYLPTWEQIPAPELVLAAAAQRTEKIKLCPGAHLLSYHHPAKLAVQTSWMSHLTQGRYILGIGSGAWPSDAYLHGIEDLSQNHKRVVEALEIMEKVWASEPFHYEGAFWSAGYPEAREETWRDLRPYGGKIEMAMAGMQAKSPSIRFAAERGLTPLAFSASPHIVSSQWDLYEQVCAENGRTANRKIQHVARDFFVADTDKEARRLAVEGPLGRAWREYLLPSYKKIGLLDQVFPGVEPSDISIDDIAENWWITGSPDTVVEKLEQFMDTCGGAWGTTLVFGQDFIDDPKPWNESMERLVNEVAPRIRTAT
jgi:alkanesulfonate monooxygenase SsuD/methylene tetrahydromethanopterin reductase-like flavin-dependent oxidoreductase (luciferase family)